MLSLDSKAADDLTIEVTTKRTEEEIRVANICSNLLLQTD